MCILDARVTVSPDTETIEKTELSELQRLKSWAWAVKKLLDSKYRRNGKKKSVIYDHIFSIMVLRFVGGCSWKEIALRLQVQHNIKLNPNTIIRFFRSHATEVSDAYSYETSLTHREQQWFMRLKTDVLAYIRAYKNEKNNKRRVVYPTSKLLRFTDVIYMLRKVEKKPWSFISAFLNKHHRLKRSPQRIRVFFHRFAVEYDYDDFYVGPGEYRARAG